MAVSQIAVTEGSGKNVASYSITESLVTKEIQRVTLNDLNGVALSIIPVSLSSAPTTPVTGTFWQATQPISTAVTGGVSGSVSTGGTSATNTVITANPLNLGAQAISSENAPITATRLAQLVTDLVGKLIVLPYANPENFVNGTTAAITDTTTTQLLASAGGTLRNYVSDLIVTNSHATVGTFVKITDGASSILWEGYAAPLGGGFAKSFSVPLRGTAATAVNVICVTTGANVIVSASGYKGI